MVNVLRFKIQLTIVFLFSLLFIFSATIFPASTINYADVFAEATISLGCLVLMFSTQNLSEQRGLYWCLFPASSMLFMGHSLDTIDEFTESLPLLDALEDIFKPSGFLLLLLGSYRWVLFHKKQSALMCQLANIDPLTGLLNRRALMNKATLMIQNARQANTQVGIIIFDIDHFKQVNDTYGHLFGDQVLLNVATTVKTILKDKDAFARLGGEEFVVLLSDASLEQATCVAEEIRAKIESLKFICKQQAVSCTVSLGVVSDFVNEANFEQLIERADKSLYEAKAQGRNCWRIAQ